MQGTFRRIRIHLFGAMLAVALSGAAVATAQTTHVIPPDALAEGPMTTGLHPHAEVINAFLTRQSAHLPGFASTGLSRADYLPMLDSIVRGMRAYQQAAGWIRDPVVGREHQYSTPAWAHGVSVLFKSGYVPMTDTSLLNAGIRAMGWSVRTMQQGVSVPDSHGDFYTILLMKAFEHFKGVVSQQQQARWRDSLGMIQTNKYINAAPNWIGINLAGEFLRHKEGLTTLDWVNGRLGFQVTRLGLDGLYQDTNAIETTNVTLAAGQSLAYDMVARAVLGVIAVGGFESSGSLASELRLRLWRGAWTGLLYQSPLGEVPTGMRSSHHIWNEGYAAVNYEMWAAQYLRAGEPEIAGAFKRAAHLSLLEMRRWLRSDGTAYVTKARYPASARWGYMAYSGLGNYNGWAMASLALAWEYADTTIAERPAPADIGGYVLPIIPGFKKVFASAGGTYVQYDLRGDQSHNPTGLLRVHLKTSLPQLGPSDGAVGPADQLQNAQYRPLYPTSDPPGERNLSIGPGWITSGAQRQVLAALVQIPQVTTLEQTPQRASFRVAYDIGQGSTLHQTVIVEPSGVTVIDSVVDGTVNDLRIFYPMLVYDGIDSTQIQLSGSSVTLQLKGKGARFRMVRPEAPLQRTGIVRNHRNGRVEAAYADVQGRVAEYRITAWPEYVSSIAHEAPRVPGDAAVARLRGGWLDVNARGAHRVEVRDLSGRVLWSRAGDVPATYDVRAVVPATHGLRVLTVSAPEGRAAWKLAP